MATKAKKPRTVTRSYSLSEKEVAEAVAQYLELREGTKVTIHLKPGRLLEMARIVRIPWVGIELEVTAEGEE